MSGDLKLEGVSKTFGSHTALHAMDLSVKQGEFVTLLGPSGCGKTTTLSLIAGFLRPDAGRIMIAGQDVSTLPPFKRHLGVVFQDYALFPHLTVAANVGYGLRMRGVKKAEITERVTAALKMVHLEALGTRMPSELSGGQRQRVALARAVVIRPSVLLLDEPLSNLDLKLREAMRLEIVALQKQLGITTIFVTHDQAEALEMSDRIVVMSHGRVEQIGTPEDIYERPATRNVATFIGQMNLLPDPTRPGQEIGFRPEAARIASPSGDGGLEVAGRLERSLYLGHRREFHIRVGDRLLVIEGHGIAPDAGSDVQIVVPREACHVFPGN